MRRSVGVAWSLLKRFWPAVFWAAFGGLCLAGCAPVAFKLLGLALVLFFIDVAFGCVWECARLKKTASELLGTIIFGCSTAALATLLLKARDSEALQVFVICMLWAFGGSSWAWHRLQILKKSDARTRWRTIRAGWGAVVGVVGAFCALLGFGSGNFVLWLLSMPVAALLIPAIQVEREVRCLTRP